MECTVCKLHGIDKEAVKEILIGPIDIPYCEFHYNCVIGVLRGSMKWNPETDKVCRPRMKL